MKQTDDGNTGKGSLANGDGAADDAICFNRMVRLVAVAMNVSGSMTDESVRAGNGVLHHLYDAIRENRCGNRSLICRVGFSDGAEVANDWAPASETDSYPDGKTGTRTDVDAGVGLALEKIAEKEEDLARNGIPREDSLLFLITDGIPTSSVDRSAAEVKKRLSEYDICGSAKFKFLPVYVGTESVPEDLLKYTGKVYAAGDTPEIFEELFGIQTSIAILPDFTLDGIQYVNLDRGDGNRLRLFGSQQENWTRCGRNSPGGQFGIAGCGQNRSEEPSARYGRKDVRYIAGRRDRYRTPNRTMRLCI